MDSIYLAIYLSGCLSVYLPIYRMTNFLHGPLAACPTYYMARADWDHGRLITGVSRLVTRVLAGGRLVTWPTYCMADLLRCRLVTLPALHAASVALADLLHALREFLGGCRVGPGALSG